MPGLGWLTAHPIAHRGLHDAGKGVIENTVTAFTEAMDGGFGIETDLQISADGEAVVYHDDALGRLTEGDQPLARLNVATLRAVRFRATTDRIQALNELCEQIAGRVPLLLELKSRFDGDLRLAARTASVLADYAGPVAVMSFDPEPIALIRRIAPKLTRGIVAERHYTHHEWDKLSAAAKFRLSFLLHAPWTRPQFLAYSVKDLSASAPKIARRLGLPLLTWTVRTEADQLRARQYADQIIFEGFKPS